MSENSISRSLHDVGLAAWFGGTLAGAVGINGAGASAKDKTERAAIASAGWAKWTPINAVAIGAHIVGSIGQIQGNKGRIVGQKNVAGAAAVKTAVTVAALAVTGYGRILGKKIELLSPAPSEGVTEPSSITPSELAATQKQEKYVQWAIPALTGALVVISPVMGEQQRPGSVTSGVAERLRGLAS